jgi:hypothetical protein
LVVMNKGLTMQTIRSGIRAEACHPGYLGVEIGMITV